MHYVIDKNIALLAKNYALFCIFAGRIYGFYDNLGELRQKRCR